MHFFNNYLLSFIILLMNFNIQSIYCESIEFISKDGKIRHNNYSTTTRRPSENLKSYLITSYNTARNKQQSNFDSRVEMPRARKISSHTEFLYPTYNNNGYSTIDQSRVDEEEKQHKQNIDRFFPPPYFSNAETNRPTELVYDITTEKPIQTIGHSISTVSPSVLAPTFTSAVESGPPDYARFPIASLSDEDDGEEGTIGHSPKHTDPVSFMPIPLDKNKSGEMDSYINAFTSQKMKDEQLVNSYSPPHTGPVKTIYPPDFDGIVYPPITQQSNQPSGDPYYPSMVVDTHLYNDSEPTNAFYGDKKQIEKHPSYPKPVLDFLASHNTGNFSASTYHELAKSKNENNSENNNERPSSVKLTTSPSSHSDFNPHEYSPNQHPQKPPTKLTSTLPEYIDFNPYDYHPQGHHLKKPPIKSNTPLPEYLDFNPQDHPENPQKYHPAIDHEQNVKKPPTKLISSSTDYLDFNPEEHHLELDYNPHGSNDQEHHAQNEQKKPRTSKPDISALPDDPDFTSQEHHIENQKMKPHRTTTNTPRGENHGYPQYLDFAPNHDPDTKYLEYIPAHDDYHHVYHEVTTTPKPMVEDQRVNKRPYSYYYLGRKLWYIPLYFSLYFIVYIFALIVKSIFRHKVQFPNDHNWGDFKSRSFNQNHHEALNTVTENVYKGFENVEYSFGPTDTHFVDTIDPTT